MAADLNQALFVAMATARQGRRQTRHHVEFPVIFKGRLVSEAGIS